MQAHNSSGVVMDIAAFKVSHPIGGDKDATALQAKKVERITFHGAMEEMSRQGQKASTPNSLR